MCSFELFRPNVWFRACKKGRVTEVHASTLVHRIEDACLPHSRGLKLKGRVMVRTQTV